MSRAPGQAAADAFARGMPAPRWDRATCRAADPRVFFPEDENGEPDEDGPKAQAARSICGRCPLREQCLRYALSVAMPAGIWGGHSTRERESMCGGGGQRGAA
jgi:WhiB family redox-sensing transcriptional regulator